MAVATGQFFLSQINGKLNLLEDGISAVMGYMEVKTQSEVIANDYSLMNIFKNLENIKKNDVERQSTLVELKMIKNQSLSNVIFFDNEVRADLKDLKLTPKSKADDLDRVFHELEQDIPQYWCALRSYINATVLGVILAGMNDPSYLSSVKADLSDLVDQYETRCTQADERIKNFIRKAKDLNKSKKLPKELVKLVDYVPIYNYIGLGIKAVVHGVDEIDSHIEKESKNKKQKALTDREVFWTACKNLMPLEESVALIDEYKRSQNSPLEIICTEDEAYIKYDDE